MYKNIVAREKEVKAFEKAEKLGYKKFMGKDVFPHIEKLREEILILREEYDRLYQD